MNERIRELLVRAGMQFRMGNIPTHIDSNGTHTFNEFYVYDKFDPEKFAELMVRDFLFQLADARLEFVWDSETDEVFKQTVAKIKAHYGVEK